MADSSWDTYNKESGHLGSDKEAAPTAPTAASDNKDPWAAYNKEHYENKKSEETSKGFVPSVAGTFEPQSKDESWGNYGKRKLNASAQALMHSLLAPVTLPMQAYKDLSKSPTAPDSNDFAGSVIRGVPVAKDLIPTGQRDAQFQQEHPNWETAGNVTGRALPALAAGPVGMSAGVPGYMAAQAGINAATGAADRGVHQQDWNAALKPKDVAMDSLLGAAGPAAGKVISPFSHWHAPQTLASNEARLASQAKWADRTDIPVSIKQAIAGTTIGEGLAYLSGMVPNGAAVSALGALKGAPAAAKQVIMSEIKPSQKAMLNALRPGDKQE